MFSLQSPGDLRGLRIWVFDILAFIENDGQPLGRDERFAQETELIVIQYMNFGLVQTVQKIVQLACGPVFDAQSRRETPGFLAANFTAADLSGHGAHRSPSTHPICRLLT